MSVCQFELISRRMRREQINMLRVDISLPGFLEEWTASDGECEDNIYNEVAR